MKGAKSFPLLFAQSLINLYVIRIQCFMYYFADFRCKIKKK